jgi:hypothetical protein
LKRDENSDIRGLAGDYLRPGEMGEPLTAELILQLWYKSDDGDESWMDTYDFEEALEVLLEHDIERITIVWEIEWTDTFRRKEDTFGNEYREQYMESGAIEEGMTFAEFARVGDFEEYSQD